MTVLCAPGDMWFSDAAFCEMEQEVPSVQVCCVCACLHLLRLILSITSCGILLQVQRLCVFCDQCWVSVQTANVFTQAHLKLIGHGDMCTCCRH